MYQICGKSTYIIPRSRGNGGILPGLQPNLDVCFKLKDLEDLSRNLSAPLKQLPNIDQNL